jgi:hypothetical protein
MTGNVHVMVGARKPRGAAYSAQDRRILAETTVKHLGGMYYGITYRGETHTVVGKPSRWETLNYVKGQMQHSSPGKE